MPAREGRRDGPRQSDPPNPRAPRGPPAEPRMRGSALTGLPPAGQTHQWLAGPPLAPRFGGPGRACRREGCAAPRRPQWGGARAGGHRPHPRRRLLGNHGATVPPSPPHSPPSGARDAGDGPSGRQPSTPPRPGEVLAPPRESRGARKGNSAQQVRHAPPRCHPHASPETMTGRRTRASTRGRDADHTWGQQANTNRSSMEATPSMN